MGGERCFGAPNRFRAARPDVHVSRATRRFGFEYDGHFDPGARRRVRWHFDPGATVTQYLRAGLPCSGTPFQAVALFPADGFSRSPTMRLSSLCVVALTIACCNAERHVFPPSPLVRQQRPMCLSIGYGPWWEQAGSDAGPDLLPAEMDYDDVVLEVDGRPWANVVTDGVERWLRIKGDLVDGQIERVQQCTCCRLCRMQNDGGQPFARCQRWSFRRADRSCRLFVPPGEGVRPAVVEQRSAEDARWYSGTGERFPRCSALSHRIASTIARLTRAAGRACSGERCFVERRGRAVSIRVPLVQPPAAPGNTPAPAAPRGARGHSPPAPEEDSPGPEVPSPAPGEAPDASPASVHMPLCLILKMCCNKNRRIIPCGQRG